MYKFHNEEKSIQRLLDGAIIPNDPKNRDWRKYQAWKKEGNKPEPEFTEEELVAKKISDIKMKEGEIVQVQMQLDVANTKGLSIASDYQKQLDDLDSELANLKSKAISKNPLPV